jgi:hypothetical protein
MGALGGIQGNDDDPTGWPKKKYNGQFVLSPRLGVSFPLR